MHSFRRLTDYLNHHTKVAGRYAVPFANDALTLIRNPLRKHPAR
ncbi:hypothetical protein MDUV_28500 [Mycolicibacterium duvalii]|uniref:Uncharacterized protein n=1 Tax=Mycolicibacterium duvalii TaxID=39688 RepID=A0A7I7K1G0_9MYCO|nr:hypothetical protein MDUV_28500 [Mycolicibacterium duvalii]